MILAWALIFIFINLLLINILTIFKKQKKVAIITASGAIVNIIANLFLISMYGFIGAAIATVLAEALVFIMLFIIAHKRLDVSLINNSLKAFLSTGAMAFLIYNIDAALNLHILVIVPISAAIYVIALLISRAISAEDINLFKGIFEK